MTFLIDTNVISESSRPRPSPAVLRWFESVRPEVQHLSVVSLGEVRSGIESLRHRDPPRAQTLDKWCSAVRRAFGPRLIAVDADVAERWGRLRASLVKSPIETTDSLIAATALTHHLTLVTRNVRHFERTGVRLLNPFE